MQSALLQIENLSVSAGEKTILEHLNLTIRPGELHVLMGPNGAGKSTLASAIMGDPRYAVTDGTIRFDGEDITESAADVRAKKGIFLSFQSPEEIPGITLENFLRTSIRAVTGKPLKVIAFGKEMKKQMKGLDMDPSYADSVVCKVKPFPSLCILKCYLNSVSEAGYYKCVLLCLLRAQAERLGDIDDNLHGLQSGVKDDYKP